MEYILISTESKSETTFFLNLLKKMQKKASTLSASEMEDFGFMLALKEAEHSSDGSLKKVKEHLAKIIAK